MISITCHPGPGDRRRLLEIHPEWVQGTRTKAVVAAAQQLVMRGQPLSLETLSKAVGLVHMMDLPILSREPAANLACLIDRLKRDYTGPAPKEMKWMKRLQSEEEHLPE